MGQYQFSPWISQVAPAGGQNTTWRSLVFRGLHQLFHRCILGHKEACMAVGKEFAVAPKKEGMQNWTPATESGPWSKIQDNAWPLLAHTDLWKTTTSETRLTGGDCFYYSWTKSFILFYSTLISLKLSGCQQCCNRDKICIVFILSLIPISVFPWLVWKSTVLDPDLQMQK